MKALIHDNRSALISLFILAITLVGVLTILSVTPKVYGPLVYDSMKSPMGVAVDSNGQIFVADSEWDRIQKFKHSGPLLGVWGKSGSGDEQFKKPHDIAIDSSDNVYVADSGNDRIQKFSNTGTYLDGWGSHCYILKRIGCKDPDGPGGLSIGDGQFYNPIGIAFDKYDNLYVTDNNNDRVQVFTNTGKFLGKWGTPGKAEGEFIAPQDISIDSSGYAYVTDTYHKIQKFVPPVIVPNKPTIYGVLVPQWQVHGTDPSTIKEPGGIDIDLSNNLYIIDMYTGVHKLKSDGTYFDHWGGFLGTGDGEFNHPQGIALNPSGTDVYVTDTGNHRVQKFTSAGDFIRWFGVYPPNIIK